MQYAISISYKYTISELCILLYPFGLHRLPAQPHQSRSTGHGNAWTRSDSTGADEAPAPEATHGRKDTETAPAAEPPQRSSPEAKRQKSQSQHDGSSGDKTAQQTLSPTRAAEIEPEPESQKRGTVDHERRRRQREGKERKEERERRENDSRNAAFLPVSPNAQQINHQSQPSTDRHGQQQKRRLFRFCFCGVCGINGDQRQF